MAGTQGSSWPPKATDRFPTAALSLASGGLRHGCLTISLSVMGVLSTHLKSGHGMCIASQGFSSFPTESVTLALSVMNPDGRGTGHEHRTRGRGVVGSMSAQAGLGRAGGMCPFTNLQRQPCFSLVFPGSAELRTPPFSFFPSPPVSTSSVHLQDQTDSCPSWSLSCRQGQKWDPDPRLSRITHLQTKPVFTP